MDISALFTSITTPPEMPLGPRPEPPQVPRKEPSVENYDHIPLAYQRPPVPPKTPLNHQEGFPVSPQQPTNYSPYGNNSTVEPNSPYKNGNSSYHQSMPSSESNISLNSISSKSSISSVSSTSRLKGPRPISMHSPTARRPMPSSLAQTPGPKLPYPLDTSESKLFSAPSGPYPLSQPQTPVTPSQYSEGSLFHMPEPQYSAVPSSPSVHLSKVPAGSSTKTGSPARRKAVDMIPQSHYPPRPTKSIFQWGIPSELLPPMPVPVDAIGGLKVGREGHYTMNLDLPEVPPLDPVRATFSVEQLTVSDFMQLQELWSLSAIAKWIYKMVIQFDAEIKIADMVSALTKLFLYRVPALEWTLAEKIASSVIDSLSSQNFINQSSAPLLVLRTSGPAVSGVVTLLSGHEGCYSNSRPFAPRDTCCYSSRCLKEPRYIQTTRVATIPTGDGSKRKVSLRAPSIKRAPSMRVSSGSGKPVPVRNTRSHSATQNMDIQSNLHSPAIFEDEDLFDPFATLEMNWRKYWHLEEADLSNIDPKLIKMQFAYHELVMSEIAYVRDLRIYLDVYGDIELMQGLSIMTDQELYCSRVFDRIREILKTNELLLSQLLAEQSSQGPYIHTLGRWIIIWAEHHLTHAAYQRYSDDYLWADSHLRKDLATNQRLQKWMEERAKDPRLTGRPHSFFFHRVLPRVARYQLLLGAILKYTPESATYERKLIQESIDACNKLTLACDERVAKQKEVLDVQNLKAHIVFKSSAVTADLKLGDKRRKLLRRGNLIRKGDMKMEWVDTHALLLDNFFVLSKTREGMNGTALYVTKPPIPLDLLVLESADEEGVTKMTSKLTLVRHNIPSSDSVNANGHSNAASSSSLNNSNINSNSNINKGNSTSSSAPTTTVEEYPPIDNEKNQALFPIRISHLGSGKSGYVLFAPTLPERNHWVKAIVEAKQARAKLAFARSAEPFSLIKLSDQFAYPEAEAPHLPVPIPDTPLYRTAGNLNDLDRVVLRRRVNCMITIGSMYLAGTEFGIWLGRPDSNKHYDWTRITNIPQRVIRLEALDSLNLLLVLCGDHNLIWYPLDQMVARGLGDPKKSLGIRLNQHRKVIDFSVSYHRGRVLLMYLQHGGTLKVVEPIRSHGASSMSTLKQAGLITASCCVDSFREVDRMLTSSDTHKISPFLKSMILTTPKSFEWTTLDTKRPVKIPTGKNPKEMQYWGRPIKIIKLDNSQLLLCYETCYVICDASGNIGVQPTTWFLEKVAGCAYYAPYLILFSQGGEFIEIRYIDEFPGRLVQIITGKDIKLLSESDDDILIRMAHPWAPGRQLLLRLIGNEVIQDNFSTSYTSSTG